MYPECYYSRMRFKPDTSRILEALHRVRFSCCNISYDRHVGTVEKLDVYEFVHRDTIMKITNKMHYTRPIQKVYSHFEYLENR
jgi:hypothetical protein